MKFQIKRYIAQLLFLISANLGALGIKTGFCYPFFYCNACPAATSGCPLRALELSVYKVSEKINLSNIESFFSSLVDKLNWKLFLYPILILGFVGTMSGRAVCGWVCPIGLLQRTTGIVPRKINKKIPFFTKIGKLKVERYFRYVKYALLIGLVIIIPFFYGFTFTDICPVGILTGTMPILALYPGKYVPNNFFYIALIIFILFLILIFLIERGWCRYFCPVGAMLAPFNKISVLHVSVNKEKCKSCDLCSKVCPMGIDVPNMHRDPECILCGKCVSNCPQKLVKYKVI